MTAGMSFGLTRRRKLLPRRFPWATRRAIPPGGIVGTGQRVHRLVSNTWLAGPAVPLPTLAVEVPGAFASGQNAGFISFNDAARFDYSVLRGPEKANASQSIDQSLLQFLYAMKSCGVM
jgi:hypothetical protein